MNTTDIVASCPGKPDAMLLLGRIRRRCRTVVLFLLESVRTQWFQQACELGAEAGVDLVVDAGLHSQHEHLQPGGGLVYHFLFNGLTAAERESARHLPSSAEERVIPWAFVGHATAARVRLLQRLVTELDPGGFAYLCQLGPVTDGGPHLNGRQFHSVLKKTRYHIWCSHHDGFYMEGERFRMSLLAGAVPLKILFGAPPAGQHVPFPYLLLDEQDFAEHLRWLDFRGLRQRFTEEFCQLPTLENGLAALLNRESTARGPAGY